MLMAEVYLISMMHSGIAAAGRRDGLQGLERDGQGVPARPAPAARQHGPEGAAPGHGPAGDLLPAGALRLLHV